MEKKKKNNYVAGCFTEDIFTKFLQKSVDFPGGKSGVLRAAVELYLITNPPTEAQCRKFNVLNTSQPYEPETVGSQVS